MNEILISHSSRDTELAGRLRDLITRISLGHIKAWYSSDRSKAGGLLPGDRWMSTMRTRLLTSKAVVALVTPNSVSRPWIYFESGFGAAIADLEVIPVAVGIDTSTIPDPLAMYQVFRLANKQDVFEFLAKLLHRFQLDFDEEMAEVVVSPIVHGMERLVQQEKLQKDDLSVTSGPHGCHDILDQFLAHVDQRLLKLANALKNTGASYKASYQVPVLFERDSKAPFTQDVTIQSEQTLHDVLDDIFFKLGSAVSQYSYLTEWVLRDMDTGVSLVVREVQDKIPASLLISPGSSREVIYLDGPFIGVEPLGFL